MEQSKKQKPIRTTLYIPPGLWKEVKILAIKRDCDATDIVVWAIEAYLKTKGERQ
jgi:hypothetical protein